MGSETLIEVILAILLPPVGVFLRFGCGILDMFGSDTPGIYTWNNICTLCTCRVVHMSFLV
uniref:Uncharacterized protein n=1 Tax=Cannabis sativa TaxID=3483 RepID=A0A803R541_CANSA